MSKEINIEEIVFNEFAELVVAVKPDVKTGFVDLQNIAEHAVYAISGSPMFKEKTAGNEEKLAKGCVKTALELLSNN